MHRSFGFLSFSVALWSFAYWRWLLAPTQESALFWIRILSIGSSLIPITFLHWVLMLTKRRKNVLVFGYLITGIFLSFNFSHYFIAGVRQISSFPFWPRPGILYHFYILSYILLNSLGIYFLFKQYRKSVGYYRAQLKYIFFGLVIAALAGLSNFPLWYGINIPPYANFLVVIYIGCFTYAMLRYRFMDIRIMISKAVVYLFFLVLSISFSFVMDFLKAYLSLKIIFSFVVIFSFLMFLLVQKFERTGANYFYPSFSREKKILSSLEKNLIYLLDLKTFSNLVQETLEKAFLLEKIAILIKDKEKRFIVQKNKGFREKDIIALANSFSLIKKLNTLRHSISPEDLEERKEWEILGIELCLPLLFQGGVIGLIFLGRKAEKNAFSQEEIRLLDYFSRQASIALKNTLFYNEEKERKEELEKFYELTIDRELKMQELKAKIRELEKKMNKI